MDSLRRLFTLARPERNRIIVGIGMLGISSGIMVSIPYNIGYIIDKVNSKKEGLTTTVLSMSALFALGGVANLTRVYLFKSSGEMIVSRLRSQLYSKLVHQNVDFFDRNRSAEIISRLASDCLLVGKTVTGNVSDGLRSGVQAIGGTCMMFHTSVQLSLFIISILPPLAVGAVVYGRYLKKLAEKTQNAVAESTEVAEEKLGNIRTLKAFTKEYAEIELYSEKVEKIKHFGLDEAKANALFFGSATFLSNCSVLGVLWTSGSLVMADQMSVGDLSSFLMYSVYVGASLSGLSWFYSEMMRGLGASKRIFEWLDTPLSKQTGLKRQIRGSIEFRNIEFEYPSRKKLIFRDLSFQIEPGQQVAIIGSSGSGKSTISSLLLKFYDPIKGEIVIDGIPLSNYDSHSIRDQIGIVSQEPTLFATSIRDNIAYGRKDATFDEIREAARQANALEFIEKMPNGFETFVGERGISLSGGQKQRIAIARACLKNAKILVLDEATSALDANSEFLVQDALRKLQDGKTVIIIAHRLSTIMNADVIFVLQDGKIVEKGNWNYLNQNGKFFKQLVEPNKHD